MRDPNIICVLSVIRDAETCQAGLPDGRYVPARALGYSSLFYRIRATWLVWTDRADALTWPGQ